MANRSTKKKALATLGRGVDARAPDWDRIRQRFASMGIRGTKIAIISTGICVRATTPQELEAALIVAMDALHEGEPEN